MYKTFDRASGRQKRHGRVRIQIAGTPTRPRLAVFRSLHHIYAQVIDDAAGRTLAAASTTDAELRKGVKAGSSAAAAAAVGKAIAARAKERGIEAVVFDRGGFPYHGRIKAVAEAAREAGLKF
jgi:large subunit ribosomal protein L18